MNTHITSVTTNREVETIPGRSASRATPVRSYSASDVVVYQENIPKEQRPTYEPIYGSGPRQELHELRRASPASVADRIVHSYKAGELGCGTSASVHALEKSSQLVVRVATKLESPNGWRGDLEGLHTPQGWDVTYQTRPELFIVPIVYTGALRALLLDGHISVPLAALVTKAHPYSTGHALAPQEALRVWNAVPAWLLERCPGEPVDGAFGYDRSMYRLRVSPILDHAKKHVSEARRECRAALAEPQSVKLTAKSRLQTTTARQRTLMKSRPVQDHLLIWDALREHVKRLHQNDGTPSPDRFQPIIQILDEAKNDTLHFITEPEGKHVRPRRRANKTFTEAYKNFTTTYISGLRESAALPQSVFDQTVQSLKVMREAGPDVGADFTHHRNFHYDKIKQKMFFSDLAFNAEYGKPTLERFLWSFLGGGKRKAASADIDAASYEWPQLWELVARPEHRQAVRVELTTIVCKLNIAAEKSAVPWLESDDDTLLLQQFCSHYDLPKFYQD